MKRKGQEEMVGFALIIIIVAVILLVFLGFSYRTSKTVEINSYEVEGFIQSFLQTTSSCEGAREFLSVKDLIFACEDGETCSDGTDTCDVRDSMLSGLIEESWNVGADAPIKGYELKIIFEDTEIFVLEEGNSTSNYRGSSEPLPRRGDIYDVSFKLYYD